MWKKGDLPKLQHIVDGIKDVLSTPIKTNSNKRKTGFVFHAFGKHLADWQNPIIDQHTIRAYDLYELLEGKKAGSHTSDNDISDLINREKVTTGSINAYYAWLDEIGARKNKDEMYNLDKIMFTVGKYAKLITDRNSPKRPRVTGINP